MRIITYAAVICLVSGLIIAFLAAITAPVTRPARSDVMGVRAWLFLLVLAVGIVAGVELHLSRVADEATTPAPREDVIVLGSGLTGEVRGQTLHLGVAPLVEPTPTPTATALPTEDAFATRV